MGLEVKVAETLTLDHRCHPGGEEPSYCQAYGRQCVAHTYSFIQSALAWPWTQAGGSNMVLALGARDPVAEQTSEQTASYAEIHAMMGMAGGVGKGKEGIWSRKSRR